jgi:selenocysteine lyase/cysteine desulfurase
VAAGTHMRTEFAFTLPRGYVDEAGTVHREGIMRLATARDEIEPLREAEVRKNEAYLAVLLLARVITRIGEVDDVTPEVVERLYAADFDHLQRLYERLNTDGEAVGAVTCPHCAQLFEVDLTDIEDGRLGE